MVHRASQAEWLSNYAGTLEPCCPRCDSHDVRNSYSTAVLDFLFKQLLDRVPLRCRHCRLRFYCKAPQQNEVLREAAAVRRWTDGLRKRLY
jgi:transcription elongation factor Elf1